MTRPPRWPQRLASLMAMLNVVYIVLVLGLVGAVIMALWRGLDAGEIDGFAEFFAGVVLAYLIAGLIIGLAIGSPLLSWLTVLAIGLWRGRRWAAIAGAITFSVTAASMVLLVTAAEDKLVVTTVEGDDPSALADPAQDPQEVGGEFFILFLSAVLAGPSLLGLLLIAYSHLPATTPLDPKRGAQDSESPHETTAASRRTLRAGSPPAPVSAQPADQIQPGSTPRRSVG